MKSSVIRAKRIASAIVLALLVSMGLGMRSGFDDRWMFYALSAFVFFIVFSLIIWADVCVHGDCKVKQKSPAFDYSMHYFRAFAILFVMATHYCTNIQHLTINKVIFTGATIYFLFISGYLCQYLYLKKPNTPSDYYIKKLKNVISPYLICTILFTIVLYFSRFGIKASIGRDFLSLLVHNVLFGTAQGQYWYIPFVVVLFFISPILTRISDCSLVLMWLTSLILAIIFPRRQFPFTLDWPGVFYLYTYFTHYYIIGFVYARYKDSLDGMLKHLWPATLLLIPTALLLAKSDFIGLHVAEDDLLISIQRFCTLWFAIYVLSFLKHMRIRILDVIAEYSFALFFFHNYFYIGFASCFAMILNVSWLVDLIMYFVFSLVILIFCILLKKVLGGWSRSVIGA